MLNRKTTYDKQKESKFLQYCEYENFKIEINESLRENNHTE